jgi:AcrR family transcriptional regulator
MLGFYCRTYVRLNRGNWMSKDLKKQFENNRQLILETASKLFTQKGIMNTSFSDISKECKLSKGTIYYYYPSKDHLIYEVTDFHFKQGTDAIFSWIGNIEAGISPDEALKLLLESIFDTSDKCKLHVCLLNEAIMGNDTLKKRFTEKYGEWKTMVEVGFLKTGANAAPVKRLTNTVFLILDGIIFLRVTDNISIDIEDACALLMEKAKV